MNYSKKLICPYCSREVAKFKTNSHIIPYWMTEQCLATSNNKVMHFDLKNQKINKVQSSLKSDFICDKCEDFFQKFDAAGAVIIGEKSPEHPWAKAVSKQIHEFLYQKTTTRYCTVYHGFNFDLLYRFILSVLLRQYMYNLVSNETCLFHEKHFKQMKSILDEPGQLLDDNVYPVIISKTESREDIVVYPRHFGKMSGHYLFRWLAYGFIFDIIVSSHTIKDDYIQIMKLSKEGTAFVFHYSQLEAVELSSWDELKTLGDSNKSKMQKWFPSMIKI